MAAESVSARMPADGVERDGGSSGGRGAHAGTSAGSAPELVSAALGARRSRRPTRSTRRPRLVPRKRPAERSTCASECAAPPRPAPWLRRRRPAPDSRRRFAAAAQVTFGNLRAAIDGISGQQRQRKRHGAVESLAVDEYHERLEYDGERGGRERLQRGNAAAHAQHGPPVRPVRLPGAGIEAEDRQGVRRHDQQIGRRHGGRVKALRLESAPATESTACPGG